MGRVADIPTDSERPRRVVFKKDVHEVEQAVIDRTSCLKKLRYNHRKLGS